MYTRIKGIIPCVPYVGFPAVFAGVNIRDVLLVDSTLMYVHVGRGLTVWVTLMRSAAEPLELGVLGGHNEVKADAGERRESDPPYYIHVGVDSDPPAPENAVFCMEL